MSLLVQAASYVGDYTPGKVVRFKFNATDVTGALATITGAVVSVYKDNGTTESTAGVTLTAAFDSRTGLYHLDVDTSADGTFYSAGSEFEAVITTGAIGAVSVIGTSVGHFSLSNRSALRPTTADRTLLVSAAGAGDANLRQVGSSSSAADGLGQLGISYDANSFVSASVVAVLDSFLSEGETGNLASCFSITFDHSDGAPALVNSYLSGVLGTALTQGVVGQLAGAFSHYFDVGTPTGTVNSLPAALPGQTGGVATAPVAAAVVTRLPGRV